MIVGASPVVRAGVASLLGHTDDISVVGTADDPLQVDRQCCELDVDVVVTSPADVVAGAATETAVGTAHWFDQLPALRVVVLTDVVDGPLVRAVSASGVDACLHLTTIGADQLASVIRGLMRGQTTYSSEFLPELIRRRGPRVPGTRLTAREGDILELLAQGSTNESIAQSLGLATGTVRIYVSGILAKLGAPNRTAAAVLAIQEGLVAPALVGHPSVN
jgi:DNA-binding NarL/FixJ family response regulator